MEEEEGRIRVGGTDEKPNFDKGFILDFVLLDGQFKLQFE